MHGLLIAKEADFVHRFRAARAFGRTETRVRIEAGRKRIVSGIRREREQWQVLITEHHEGYIDWQTYEHNQRVIADNTNMKGEMARGALRKGEALLAGLLRCGHCGRKLHVGYTGKNGNTSRYICRGASINHGASGNCIAFGSIRIDQGVSVEVLRLLRPVAFARLIWYGVKNPTSRSFPSCATSASRHYPSHSDCTMET